MASERRLRAAAVILALFVGADGTAALGALPSTLDFNLAIAWIIPSRFCSKPISAASRSMLSTVILGISGDYIEKLSSFEAHRETDRIRCCWKKAT